MSYELNCVIDGCDASITEESEEEVLETAGQHAEEAHPNLELDDETLATIRSNINEV